MKSLVFAGALVFAATVSHAAPRPGQAVPPPPTATRPAQPAKAVPPPPPAPVPAPAYVAVEDERGARETRDRLNRVFEQYPPTVRQVLRLDPSLLQRPEYLANYPALESFVAQHPEVVHNPAFFVGDANGAINWEEGREPKAGIELIRAMRNFFEFVGISLIVLIVATGIVTIVRTLVEQFRWQRMSRMQIDMHNKLIDRLSGSDELLAYLQSPVGRSLADFQMGGTMSSDSTLFRESGRWPLGRIFWPLQVGVVLTAAGAGLMMSAGRWEVYEVERFFSGVSVLAFAVGIGFIVSALATFVISNHLGLIRLPRRNGIGDNNANV